MAGTTRWTRRDHGAVQALRGLVACGVLAAALGGAACGGGDKAPPPPPPTADTTPPAVTASTPVDGAAEVLTTAPVTVTFSEAMDAASVSAAFTVATAAGPIEGAVTWDPATRTATFAPAAPLSPATSHTAAVATGARDLAGNALPARHAFGFTTVGVPEVHSTEPRDGATGTHWGGWVRIYFSGTMDAASVTQAFTLSTGGVAVPGTAEYFPPGEVSELRFQPAAPLAPFTTYTAVLSTAARSASGVPITSAYAFSFTTGQGPQWTLAVLNDPGTHWMNAYGRVTDDAGQIDCGGIGTRCDASYDVGKVVTLTAVPAPTATFIGWGGDDCSAAGTNPTATVSLPVGRSGTCAAHFEPNRTGTVMVTVGIGGWIQRVSDDSGYLLYTDPRKLDCGSAARLSPAVCSATFGIGMDVWFRAEPDPLAPAGTITWRCTSDDLAVPPTQPEVIRTGTHVSFNMTRDRTCYVELVP